MQHIYVAREKESIKWTVRMLTGSMEEVGSGSCVYQQAWIALSHLGRVPLCVLVLKLSPKALDPCTGDKPALLLCAALAWLIDRALWTWAITLQLPGNHCRQIWSPPPSLHSQGCHCPCLWCGCPWHPGCPPSWSKPVLAPPWQVDSYPWYWMTLWEWEITRSDLCF